MPDGGPRRRRYEDLVITWDYLPGTRDLRVRATHSIPGGGGGTQKGEEPYALNLDVPALAALAGRERLVAEVGTLMPHIELAAYGKGTESTLRGLFEPGESGSETAPEEAVGSETEPEGEEEFTRLPGRASGRASGMKRADLDELGRTLFRSLFRETKLRDFYIGVRQNLDQVRDENDATLRIRIRLDLLGKGPESADQRLLARLPWECLRADTDDHETFWGVEVGSPIIRDVESDSQANVRPIRERLNVLLVCANPPDTKPLNIQRETEAITEQFATAAGENGVASAEVRFTVLEKASFGLVRDALIENEFHVLHFIGHGEYDQEKGGSLLLHKDPDRPEADRSDSVGFADWLDLIREQRGDLRLVLINACNTGAEGENEKKPLNAAESDAVGGLATSILKMDVPAVVAMQFQIGDKAAIVFAQEFYKRVAAYTTVEEAVSRARWQVRYEERRSNSSFWLTPVLYMRDGFDGVLLSRPAQQDQDEDEKDVAPVIPPTPVGPGPEPPPDDIAAAQADEDFMLWFTEHDGKLVLNWRILAAPKFGDFVALYDGPPTDVEYGYEERRAANVSLEPNPETQLYRTELDFESDRYYLAYLTDGGSTVLATWPRLDPES